MNDSSLQAAIPVIAARELTKAYPMAGGRLEVLRGVSLDLAAGETCAMVGRSGSGKSTLLHLLGLLDRPDAGIVRLEGGEVQGMGPSESAKVRARGIGFVFQQFHLLPELDALQNVLLPRRIVSGLGWWTRAKTEKEKARALLDRVGLGDRIGHRPSQLSGGEQQRVALARALVSNPAVVLADEPTGNLDRESGRTILELLLEAARERGAAVLVATHAESVAQACDRIVHLRNGAIGA